jgi:hypothetical protein
MAPIAAAMAAIPTWVTVAASVVSAIGSISRANSQAKMMERNASIADQNAALFTQQAAEEERRKRVQLNALLGHNRTAVAKSGVTMSGTPLLVEEDTVMQGELDALTIRYNGELKANNQRYQASMGRYQAEETRSQGYMSAAGSILGGVASYGQQEALLAAKAGSGGGTGLMAPTSVAKYPYIRN